MMNLVSQLSGTDPAAAVTPEMLRLKKAAQDFEGLLLSSLWKGMAEDMKNSMEGDSINSSFTDMGLQAVAGGMAAAGGIGIGRMLLKALEKQDSAEVHGPSITTPG